MKLSPPASSSDLEAAREIARRLHQRRRRGDRPETDEPAPAPRAAVRFAPVPPPPAPTPVEVPPAPPESPTPPSWDEGPAEAAAPPEPHLDALGLDGPSPEAALPEDVVPDLDVEEPGVSPEELVGVGTPEAPPSFEDLPNPEGEALPSSPFDVDLDEAAAEDLVVPAPPSWDDIAVACLDIAQTHGAMLIDPSGLVVAACGEWPEPGPEAIAAKLVSTMNRTLKDAPTRSISAPLMGKHLTAWRVPLAGGLVTTAFIGDASVRAEARPAIDAEIRRGPGD